MRCLSRLNGTSVAAILLAALVICGLSGGIAGCNDKGEQEMMQQMLSSGNNSGTQTAAPADRAAAGETPALGAAQNAGEQTAEDTAQPELVENVTVEVVEVKAPYPEFDGEGRYDVRVTCLLKDYEEAQVYRIVALDAEGNEVGSQDKHLKLPLKKARTFDFNEFYCTHMPVSIAFYRTDKEAVAAGEGGGSTATKGRVGTAGTGSGDAPAAGLGQKGEE